MSESVYEWHLWWKYLEAAYLFRVCDYVRTDEVYDRLKNKSHSVLPFNARWSEYD